MSKLEVTYEYPNKAAAARLNSLGGIDDKKARLEKGLRMALNATALESWSHNNHGRKLKVLDTITQRPPLFILEGDVGVGKTALAESIGDTVARTEKIDIWLYRLSLSSRGTGMVGEMTTHLASAFDQVADAASKLKLPNASIKGACILLIDEADALVQSRESSQMHHEDRAGVNTIIRGIDDISARGLPVAVIMCTNRLSAIDPAIQRRAADILHFERPNQIQRKIILTNYLSDLTFSTQQIDQLVAACGEPASKPGYTFSDLTQRYLPALVVDAFPSKAITFERALEIMKNIKATPIFQDSINGQ